MTPAIFLLGKPERMCN